MKGKKGLYIIIAVVILLVVGAMFFARGGTEVDTVMAQKDSVSLTVEDTALVQAAEDYNIYSTQNARCKNIQVEIGQSVDENQLLIQLENPELELQLTENRSLLAQAQASVEAASAGIKRLELQLADARSDLSRIENLYEQGAVSKSEYEKAVLSVNTSQQALNEQSSYYNTLLSQVNGLQDSLSRLSKLESDLKVYSPIQGVVLSLPVKNDQPVASGTLLISIAAVQDLEIKADILSDDLGEIQVGQNVSITAPVLGDITLEGKVLKIYPQAEEKTSALGVIQRRVPIIISIDNTGNLKPGYEVRVAIETKRVEDAIILPIESVRSSNDGGKEVMLIEDNRVKYQAVETGLSNSNNIEIKSGIKEGDLVVRDAGLDLKENLKVKPLEQ